MMEITTEWNKHQLGLAFQHCHNPETGKDKDKAKRELLTFLEEVSDHLNVEIFGVGMIATIVEHLVPEHFTDKMTNDVVAYLKENYGGSK